MASSAAVRRRRLSVLRSILTGYGFLFPSLVFLGAFTVYPVFSSLQLSLTKWELMRKPTFIGFRNYVALFSDERFWQVLTNTFYYVGVVMPLGIVVSLMLAVALNQKIHGLRVFRAIFFLPVISTWVAVAVVWRWMYNYEFGVFNHFLSMVGIPPVDWLGSLAWAMPSVIVVSVWKSAGYAMMIFLAGLQGIPTVYYEASEIDGAKGSHQFFYITLPLLTPSILFVAVMSTISSFQVFGPIYIMTDGGPLGATDVLIFYLFESGFRFYQMGYASAIAWILFLFIFALTIIQMTLSKKWVHYG
jgi:multiple sugar transport system permease protein